MEILKILHYIVMVTGAVAQITHYLERVSGNSPNDGEALSIGEEFLEKIWNDSLIGNYVAQNMDANLGRVYRFVPGVEPSSVALGDITPTCDTNAVGDMLPFQVACRIVTQSTGRNVPGSWYLPGQTVQHLLSTGKYNAPFVAACLAYGASAQSDFNHAGTGSTWRPRKFSLKDAGMINIQGDVSVNDVPDTQRRRKPGVGS